MPKKGFISGWLTKKDIELLEESSKKPEREKTFVIKHKCSECSYEWFYEAVRCPMCFSLKVEKA